jgi:outer membrane immunogenic protein
MTPSSALSPMKFGNVDGSDRFVGPGALPSITSVHAEMEWTGSLRGRFGVLLNERTLLYGTAGLAIAEIEHSMSSGAAAFFYDNWDKTYLGVTAGGGVEFAWTDLITSYVEGRWTGFGDESYSSPAPGLNGHTLGFDSFQVQAGLSVKLGNWLGGY